MQLPYELCKTLGYNVVMVNASKTLSPQDEVRLVRNATTWAERLPAILHGHFAFIDFDKLSAFTDGGRAPKPIYINVVRKPLDRLVSYYYFLRYGDDFRSEKIRSRMGDTVTFDECVSRKASFDCDPKKMWLQIPWFCGSFKKVVHVLG
jgi:heparan sulfate 2-O-sulfotransferase HS2ST1